MNRIILSAILIGQLLIAPFAWSATYYACIAGDINAANAWEDSAACDGTTYTITGAFPAAGDILESNGQAMVVNVDPGPNGAVTLKNTAGGGFTTATSTSPITITANGTAVGAVLLTITGAADAANVLTIAGDTTWTGGDGAGEYAINDQHTIGTVVFGSAGHVVTVVAGSNGTANGYYTITAGSGGLINGWVAAVGVGAHGWHSLGRVSTTFNSGSSCTGSDTGNTAVGCFLSNSSELNFLALTGKIINGARSVGVYGPIRYTPEAPTAGSVGDYVKFNGGGTVVYVGKVTNEAAADVAAKVATGEYFIKSDDGVVTQGTAAAGGGGGAWGF